MSSQPVVCLAPRPEPLRGSQTPVSPLLPSETMAAVLVYSVAFVLLPPGLHPVDRMSSSEG